MLRTALATLAVALLGGPAAASAGPATFTTGVLDGGVAALPAPDRAAWLAKVPTVGASQVRLIARWSQIAPTRPPAEAAHDPRWAGYDFAATDAQIRDAHAAGLRVLLTIDTAPKWAEGPGRTTRNREGAGTWMPDATAFGAFAETVARRYDGTVPDVLNPAQPLPRVDRFQVWNEPNLNLYLSPQYDREGRPFAAVRYRDLLNAAYDGIRAAQPRALVATAGLAPYGDPGTKGYRSRPVAFLRSMLCLGPDLRATCNVRTRMDVLALNPYAVDRPSRSALHGDDATVPDFKRLTAVTDAARRARTLGPKPPRRWVTEFSYDSSPPDPDGVASATRARYIAQTSHLLWKQGVDTMFWYLLRDEAPTPNYASTYQSGLFLRDGAEKPDAVAFRFPVVVTGRGRRRVALWFRSPGDGRARVQVATAGTWRTVRRVRVRTDGVGRVVVPRAGATAVRLVLNGASSYAAPIA